MAELMGTNRDKRKGYFMVSSPFFHEKTLDTAPPL
jgi:hypothetical protein